MKHTHMRLSEVIARLQEIAKAHGDVDLSLAIEHEDHEGETCLAVHDVSFSDFSGAWLHWYAP